MVSIVLASAVGSRSISIWLPKEATYFKSSVPQDYAQYFDRGYDMRCRQFCNVVGRTEASIVHVSVLEEANIER